MTTTEYTMPQQSLARVFFRIPAYLRLTFFASFLLCLLIHHQAYTDSLVNFDNLNHFFGSDYGVASGRWLLPVVLKLHGSWSMPWFIGLLSAVFLSLSVCVMVEMTHIRSTVGCLLAAGLVVSVPAVTNNHYYIFSADAYMISLLLSCLGAWCPVNCRRGGILLGAAAFALSAGIYQAYLSVGAGLLVGTMIFRLLDEETDAKTVLLNGVRYVISLGLGIAVYYALVKLTTINTPLVDYKGLSEMGSISLRSLLSGLFYAYGYPLRFLTNYYGLQPLYATAALAVMLLTAAVLGVWVLRVQKADKAKIALLVLLVPIFLLATNLIKLLSPASAQYWLMYFGYVLLPLDPLGLVEYLWHKGDTSRLLQRGTWVVMACALVLTFNYSLRANEVYFKTRLVQQESISYGNRLLTTVQQTEGYTVGMPVVLLGAEDAEADPAPELDAWHIYSDMNMQQLIRSYTYDEFLRIYCGWEGEIYTTANLTAAYADLPEVQSLTVYPTQGSSCVVNGAVVVRMS